MRLAIIALGLALGITASPVAHGQGRVGDSDDYVCNHGAPNDARTVAACARLHDYTNSPPPPVAEASATSGFGSPPAAMENQPSPAYQRGVADRQRYEGWYRDLSGDRLAGASYWAANRSVRGHAPCAGPGSPGASAEWTAGCLAAQSWLSGPDQLRHLNPDYRLGWNSIPNDQPVSTPASEQPAAENVAPAPPPVAAPTSPADNLPAAPTPPPAPTSNWAGLAAVGVVVGVIVLGVLGLAIYFLPTLIAAGRRKRNTLALFALNLFLGWTFLGWILALVWSLSVDPQPVQVISRDL